MIVEQALTSGRGRHFIGNLNPGEDQAPDQVVGYGAGGTECVWILITYLSGGYYLKL